MNISFVFPGFLIALAVITVPIIIHLFNFRKFKKVKFTNVRFLKELKQETTSRSKLKHLLVLASRILALTFLVLAFSQPYIPSASGNKIAAERAVSIFVDNSFSMEAVTREGTLLDIARKQARDLALTFKPSDQFQLLTCDFDPLHQRMVSREEFLSLLDGIKVSSATRRMSEILPRQTDALQISDATDKSAVIISDFQKTMSNLDEVPVDSSVKVFLVPVKANELANISIDSCWFTQPVIQKGQAVELTARIRNTGQLDATGIPVKLTINGVQKAVAATEITSGNYSDVILTFTTNESGWHKAVISISDHPITFDDQFYFSFNVSEQAELLSINRSTPGPYLTALFGNDQYFKLSNVDEKQIDYGSLPSYQAVFLNELQNLSSGLATEIKKYISNGGTLVIIPDSSADLMSYSEFLNTIGIAPFTGKVFSRERVENLTLEDPLFQGVFSSQAKQGEQTDLPFADSYFTRGQSGQSGGETLMKLRSGAPFLSRYVKGNGQVYLFSTSFSGNMSNFSRHAIFVPVIYRMALSAGQSSLLSYTIGKDDMINLPMVSLSGDQVLHLTNKENGFDAIPGHRSTGNGTVVNINNQVNEAGHYELKKSDQTVAVPSFNFNRDESEMAFTGKDMLEQKVTERKLDFNILDGVSESLSKQFSQINEGTGLWKICILLALLFLACEIALLKLWKQ